MHLAPLRWTAIMAMGALVLTAQATAQSPTARSMASEALTFQTTDTRIGRLEFERGYPSQATVKTLFDQMDFQRATQAYLWSLPLMGFARWQQQHEQVSRVGNFRFPYLGNFGFPLT